MNFRRLLPIPLVLSAACAAFAPLQRPPAAPAAPPPGQAAPGAVHGYTLEEEARILTIEDRRDFDSALAASWLADPNPPHRMRMALALGRIGPATFVDSNGNGERDAGERQAGVDLLVPLVKDTSAAVRAHAAFALGEIGDPAAVDALTQFATDSDASVAAEAVEALSKLASRVPLATYLRFTAEGPEGVRARAIRYLFRFATDEASAAAAAQLASPSPLFRQESVYALSRRSYAPAREQLELLTGDPDVLTRSYVASALGRIASKESLTPLIAMLRDVHPWVRTNAAVAIARIAAKDASAIARPELAQDSLRIIELAEDPDPGTRAASIDTIGHYAAKSTVAQARLMAIIENGSRWERELAVGAWARLAGSNPSVPLVEPRTPWERVRTLEAASTSPAGVTLRRRYAADSDPMVRANAVSTIPDAGVDGEVDLVRGALEDADVIVRASAIERLSKSKSGDLEAFTVAEKRARTDVMNDARLAAITAIGEMDVAGREPFLRTLLADNDPVVRRVAADLIEQKLDRNRPQYTPLSATRTTADYDRIVEWSRQPHTATIHMTRGLIGVTLMAQDAPVTTWNFAELARNHYFDNTTFMRVVPNFVVQGGDPRNDMNGGPGYAIRDEINLQKYTRGAVGMALSGLDTGGSQFFVTHSPQPHLDGGYTIFGRVSEGMSAVVDQIERGDRVETITIDERR